MHDCSCLMERIVSHRLDCGVHRDTAEHMLTLSVNIIRVQVLQYANGETHFTVPLIGKVGFWLKL